MKKVINRDAELLKIVIYCPNLDKEVIIPERNYSVTGWSYSNEDNYYSDSGATIYVYKCECGKSHDISI